MGKSHLTDGYSSGGEELTVREREGWHAMKRQGRGDLSVSAQTIEAE